MSDEELTDVQWRITLRPTGTSPDREVTALAAYHRFTEVTPVFIEFKDRIHKTVYTVSANDVIEVRRCAEDAA